MGEQIKLNKLINSPYLSAEDFDTIVSKANSEKIFYFDFNPKNPSNQIGFILLKIYYGSNIIFARNNCSLKLIFKLINEYSDLVESFLLNVIATQEIKNLCNEIYLNPEELIGESYCSNKNLTILLHHLKESNL